MVYESKCEKRSPTVISESKSSPYTPVLWLLNVYLVCKVAVHKDFMICKAMSVIHTAGNFECEKHPAFTK